MVRDFIEKGEQKPKVLEVPKEKEETKSENSSFD